MNEQEKIQILIEIDRIIWVFNEDHQVTWLCSISVLWMMEFSCKGGKIVRTTRKFYEYWSNLRALPPNTHSSRNEKKIWISSNAKPTNDIFSQPVALFTHFRFFFSFFFPYFYLYSCVKIEKKRKINYGSLCYFQACWTLQHWCWQKEVGTNFV